MGTNGQFWREIADQRGTPLRTLDDVQKALTDAKRTKADASLARLMLRHGRLTDEAHGWIRNEYPAAA